MSKGTFFSIVIPTYNRASFITKTIESVLTQTYKNFEIIIVDDGSTDNTEEVVSNIEDKRLSYYKKENAERGAARNYGKLIAKGDYVSFVDSDDLVYKNHLSEALKIIKIRNKPEFFHLGYDIKSPNNRLIAQVNDLSNDVGLKLIKGNNLSCNGVFLRRDIAIRFSFSEERELSGFEDWELWLRLASRFKLYYLNTITSTVINHDERSVLLTNKTALIRRQEVLIESLNNDKSFNEVFGYKLHILKANLYTYVALHLAITKLYRKDAIQYLVKGVLLNPVEIISRRFLAIIKHVIL